MPAPAVAQQAGPTPEDFAFARLASFHSWFWEDEKPAKHHRLTCRFLEALDTGKMQGQPFRDPEGGPFRRFMEFAPPGSAKTRYVSHDFPAWYLGRNPKRRVLACSHTTEYAQDNGQIVRDLVAQPDFQAIFSAGLRAGSAAKDRWGIIGALGPPYGQYLGAGVGKAITGRRFDLGIIDDAIKDADVADSLTQRDAIWKWYLTSFRIRRKPKAVIAIINTRWHEDDLCGRILPENWEPATGWVKARDGEWWYVLNIPALAEANDPLGRAPGEGLWLEYFGQAHWEQERRSQLPRFWSALFQQRPTPESGAYFKAEWRLNYGNSEYGANRPLPPKSQLQFYQSSDYAVTDGGGDFTVHGAWAVDSEGNAYLLHCWFEQMGAEEIIEAGVDMALMFGPLWWFNPRDVIMKSLGPGLKRRMQERNCFVALESISEAGDKAMKARSFQGRVSMGKVFYPCPRTYPQTEIWSAWLWRQMLKFPSGTIDDGVDMQSIFFRGLDVVIGGTKPPTPIPELVLNTSQPTFDQAVKAHFAKRKRQRTGD